MIVDHEQARKMSLNELLVEVRSGMRLGQDGPSIALGEVERRIDQVNAASTKLMHSLHIDPKEFDKRTA